MYSFHTRQTARKSTDRPANRCKVSTDLQHLGASQGAYDASDKVIKFMAREKKVDRDRHVCDAHGQEGLSSTSSASTQSCLLPEHWTPRSAYVSTVNAVNRSAVDAQVTQTLMAELVEKQRALLDGAELGPLNSTLVADIKKASGLLKMMGKIIVKLTANIRKQCREISEAAISVVRVCDAQQGHCGYLAHYELQGPMDKKHSVRNMHRT